MWVLDPIQIDPIQIKVHQLKQIYWKQVNISILYHKLVIIVKFK